MRHLDTHTRVIAEAQCLTHLFVQCIRCCDAILAGRVQQRPRYQPLQFVQGFDVLWVVEICHWSQLRQLLAGRSQASLVDLPLEEADFEVLQRCFVARKLLRVPAMQLLCFRQHGALHPELIVATSCGADQQPCARGAKAPANSLLLL